MDSRSGALITHRALQRFQPLPHQLDEDGRKASLEDPLHRRRMEYLQVARPTQQMGGVPALRRVVKRPTLTAQTADVSSFASITA